MILTIDIGNSNIVSTLHDENGKIIADDRRKTVREASFDTYEKILKELKESLKYNKLDAIILSCVVPYITTTVTEVLSQLEKGVKVFTLSTELVPDMKVKLKRPRELGADIIATAIGARRKYNDTCIIADLGSASKLSVITKDNEFLGGVIMPGIEFQAKSLHMMIPHLPEITLKKPETIIGNGTTDSIQSGIIYGTLASIIELSKEIEEEIGLKSKKIITGGLSKLFTDDELEGFIYDEFLLNDGLYYIAKDQLEKN